MLNRSLVAAVVMSTAPELAAQTELSLWFETTNGTDWTFTAELLNPTGTVIAAISDLDFTMFGTNIDNFEYNPAFDSEFFGDATVLASATSVDFLGQNTLPPLNNVSGPDSSNPLTIATFTADSIDELAFVFNGQVTGAYAGVPFPRILTYQDANGNPGNTPWSFRPIPPPSSVALLGLGGLAAARRRR